MPEVACLMFTAFSHGEALLDSIMAGAAGSVVKQIRGFDLAGAVRMAAGGWLALMVTAHRRGVRGGSPSTLIHQGMSRTLYGPMTTYPDRPG